MAFKKRVQESVNAAKDLITESVEKVYDISKKDYAVNIGLDKDGVKHEVTTIRPTKSTIKWRSKGY
jgi:hypothetical protein